MAPGENRRIYRVQIKDGISASLTADSCQVPVQLVDLNGGGAGLFVASKDAPVVLAASTIELQFSLKGKPKEVRTRARVAWSKVVVSDAGPGKHIGLHFLEPSGLHAQLDLHFWRYFNRRASRRAHFAPQSIRARIAHPKGGMDGWLADLGTLGLAIELPPTTPVIALPRQSVGALFTIPGSSDPVRMQAQVAYRLAQTSANRLGLAFDRLASPTFEVQRQAIVDCLADSPDVD